MNVKPVERVTMRIVPVPAPVERESVPASQMTYKWLKIDYSTFAHTKPPLSPVSLVPVNQVLKEIYKPALIQSLFFENCFVRQFNDSTPPVKKPWPLRAKQRLYNRTYRARLKLASKIAGFDVEDKWWP